MSEKLSFRLVTGRFAPGWVLASLVLLGCQSPEVKACHTAMTTSQGALLSVDKESRASVESVLAEVEKARDACKSAGLKSETKSTEDAVRSLRTLLEVQQERAKRAQVKPLSPEEQAELIKKGDPSCPRGEAYQLGEPSKLVSSSSGRPAHRRSVCALWRSPASLGRRQRLACSASSLRS